jgi:hypothetical protein
MGELAVFILNASYQLNIGPQVALIALSQVKVLNYKACLSDLIQGDSGCRCNIDTEGT